MFSRVLRNARQKKHKDRPGRKACSSLTIKFYNKWWLNTGSKFTQCFFVQSQPSFNGHIFKTDTSIRRTPGSGPCLSLFRDRHILIVLVLEGFYCISLLIELEFGNRSSWRKTSRKGLNKQQSSYVSRRSLPGFKSRALLLSWMKITLTHCACTLAPGLHPYLFQITKI